MLNKFFPQISELRNLTQVDVRESPLLSQLVAQGIQFFPMENNSYGSQPFSQFYNSGPVQRTDNGVTSNYTARWHLDCTSEWEFYAQFDNLTDLPTFNRVAIVISHFSTGVFLFQSVRIPYVDILFFGGTTCHCTYSPEGSPTYPPEFMWRLDNENRITWSSLVEVANTEQAVLQQLVTTGGRMSHTR